jgi:hypothetical protein
MRSGKPLTTTINGPPKPRNVDDVLAALNCPVNAAPYPPSTGKESGFERSHSSQVVRNETQPRDRAACGAARVARQPHRGLHGALSLGSGSRPCYLSHTTWKAKVQWFLRLAPSPIVDYATLPRAPILALLLLYTRGIT